MPSCRPALVPVLACVALLATAAAAQQSPPRRPPAGAQLVPPPRPDRAASRTLDRAVNALDSHSLPQFHTSIGGLFASTQGGVLPALFWLRFMPEEAPHGPKWIQTSFRQKVDLHGLSCRAEGRYLVGPDQRLRLDLAVDLGDAQGHILIVSDGTTLWQSQQVGSAARTVTRADLKKILETANQPGAAGMLRQEFATLNGFAGLAPLLQSIRFRMVMTEQEKIDWDGRPVLRVTGVWNRPAPPDSHWPSFLPRRCRLYLDRTTYWPYRIEWLGPAPPDPADRVLVEMEFPDPELAEAPPESAFKFDAGTRRPRDITREILDNLRTRGR